MISIALFTTGGSCEKISNPHTEQWEYPSKRWISEKGQIVPKMIKKSGIIIENHQPVCMKDSTDINDDDLPNISQKLSHIKYNFNIVTCGLDAIADVSRIILGLSPTESSDSKRIVVFMGSEYPADNWPKNDFLFNLGLACSLKSGSKPGFYYIKDQKIHKQQL